MAELLIGVAELGEAEGRILRRWSVRTGVAVMLIAVAGLILLASVGFLLASLFLYCSEIWGTTVAALVVGTVLLFIAFLVFWAALRMTR